MIGLQVTPSPGCFRRHPQTVLEWRPFQPSLGFFEECTPGPGLRALGTPEHNFSKKKHAWDHSLTVRARVLRDKRVDALGKGVQLLLADDECFVCADCVPAHGDSATAVAACHGGAVADVRLRPCRDDVGRRRDAAAGECGHATRPRLLVASRYDVTDEPATLSASARCPRLEAAGAEARPRQEDARRGGTGGRGVPAPWAAHAAALAALAGVPGVGVQRGHRAWRRRALHASAPVSPHPRHSRRHGPHGRHARFRGLWLHRRRRRRRPRRRRRTAATETGTGCHTSCTDEHCHGVRARDAAGDLCVAGRTDPGAGDCVAREHADVDGDGRVAFDLRAVLADHPHAPDGADVDHVADSHERRVVHWRRAPPVHRLAEPGVRGLRHAHVLSVARAARPNAEDVPHEARARLQNQPQVLARRSLPRPRLNPCPTARMGAGRRMTHPRRSVCRSQG